MKKVIFILALALLSLCFVFIDKGEKSTTSIRLRFNKNYKGDTITRQKTGLVWALSYLGAELPKHSLEAALEPINEHTFELHIDRVGFNEEAVSAFSEIIGSLKASEEYKKLGGIDLGEFVVYTIGSSWHYYKITGAAPTYNDYRQKKGAEDEIIFPVLNSEIARHHRRLRLPASNDVLKMSFVAEEGEGDLRTGTFKPVTYEVFDIMKNGQLRVAIYGADGKLQHASGKKFGGAGKPVKCLWCHEIYIEPLFTPNDSVQGYMSPRQFQLYVSSKMEALKAYRSTLNGEVDFTQTQDHALMELLYITYMQPSVIKLSGEWGKNGSSLSEQLKGLKRHKHGEYAFLDNLMERSQVRSYSPYKTVSLPDSIWEENGSEPTIFKTR